MPSRGWGEGELLDTAEDTSINTMVKKCTSLSSPPVPAHDAHRQAQASTTQHWHPRSRASQSLCQRHPVNATRSSTRPTTSSSGRTSRPRRRRFSGTPIPSGFIAVGFRPSTGTPGAGADVGTETLASTRSAHWQVTLNNVINPGDDSNTCEELYKGGATLFPPSRACHARRRRGREVAAQQRRRRRRAARPAVQVRAADARLVVVLARLGVSGA